MGHRRKRLSWTRDEETLDQVRDEGRAAYLAGAAWRDCPYTDPERRLAWRTGWKLERWADGGAPE